MQLFRFRAISSRTGRPFPVEIFLTDRSHGYTPTQPGMFLVIHPVHDQEQAWYAMAWNARIALGESAGGDFELLIDEQTHDVEVRELPVRDAA